MSSEFSRLCDVLMQLLSLAPTLLMVAASVIVLVRGWHGPGAAMLIGSALSLLIALGQAAVWISAIMFDAHSPALFRISSAAGMIRLVMMLVFACGVAWLAFAVPRRHRN